jgi:NADPH:quinone reductase-like Zn-dependent oxidoreductase
MAHEATLQMHAATIERFGGLDELHVRDIPKPGAASDEVLIRVHAAGVGIWDSMQRRGELSSAAPSFPLVLGAECSGVIESVGSDVTSLHPGDDVYTYFYGKQGAYAQYVAVKANAVARKPDSLSFEQAAAVPTVAITAHQAIVDQLKVAPGEWFFVAGAAGGVGSIAAQIGVALGANVIASARGDDFAYLESFGIVPANLIDYTQSDVVAAVHALTGGNGADAALDAVGGEHSKETMRAVRDGGRLAELTGQELPDERNVSVAHVQSKPSAQRLALLGAMFDAGALKVHVGNVFSLGQVREAQAAVEHHEGRGNIVLSVV